MDVLHLLPALSLGIRVRWQVCDVELSPTLEGHNQRVPLVLIGSDLSH